MAAISYQLSRSGLRLGAAVYWRRRIVALLIFLLALLALAGSVLALATAASRLRSVPHAASEPRSLSTELVGRQVHIVQPGDTLWSIARAVHPTGDVRAVVQQLADSRHGAALQVGERIEIPTEISGARR